MMSDRKSPVHVYQEISETPPQIINKKTKGTYIGYTFMKHNFYKYILG